MKYDRQLAEAERMYTAAHTAHYAEHNLASALRQYQEIINLNPATLQASYAREQVNNIAHSVVPQDQLMDAQCALALAHLEPSGDGVLASESRVPSQS